MPTHTDSFNAATHQILARMESMGLDSQSRDFVLQMRRSMTIPTVRTVMVPTFHQMNFYPAQGFCEPITAAWVDKMGPDWEIRYISSSAWTYGPHFFARHQKTGQVLDITYDQYAVRGIRIPYQLGRPVQMDRRRQKVLEKYLTAMASSGRKD